MTSDMKNGAAISHGGNSHLDEGIALARQGDHDSARAVFRRLIHQDPHNEDAWLWLSWVSESRQESLRLLEEARALSPDSERIAEGIAWAREQLGITVEGANGRDRTAATPKPRSRRRKEAVARTKPAPSTRAAALPRQPEAQTASAPPKSYADELPSSGTGTRRMAAMLSSGAAIAAMVLLMLLVITQSRQDPRVVQALELPPAVEVTATPPASQRAQPLWVQVDVAYTRGDWNTAIDVLERIRQIDPQSAEARARLAEAHFNRGMRLIDANQLDAANQELDQAVRLDAGSHKLQQARRELRVYMEGLEAFWERDWPRAVETLQSIYTTNPEFRDTRTMLAQSYFELGISRQEARVWDEAKEAYQAAMELSGDMPEAQARLTQVLDEITPPRRIEVSLTTRQVKLYENNEVVRTYLSCTGRPTAPTLPGRYEIQSKMPMAYASKWDLNMPWWLGIYWAGGSENGFHALPILSNGTILWRGYLGQGCSFGCIVLDTEDAKAVYDWAELGTVVFITR
jgi:tetratricopeptide (TPR) repeat protein